MVTMDIPQIETIDESLKVCGGAKGAVHLFNSAVTRWYKEYARKRLLAGIMPEDIARDIEDGSVRPPGRLPKTEAEKQLEGITKLDPNVRAEFEKLLAADIAKRKAG